jgi:anthranilate synthase/aminodeoxychorismate synthase-like glutamine amidotransferase
VVSDPPRIVVIDNYDSFTYNLVQYIGELGAEPIVHRNDAIDRAGVEALGPDGIVISPGPGDPSDPKYFGVCAELLRRTARDVPTLGVCLGLQGFGHVYGARFVHAPRLMHGKASPVVHDGKGVFEGIPSPFMAGRYHSLMVDPATLPDEVVPTAWTQDQRELMGARHVEHPIEGVQFHPESVLTEHGHRLVRNFLERCRVWKA